jgi:regulator of protease activity HflC (stomatin/prohibitin superfamily)
MSLTLPLVFLMIVAIILVAKSIVVVPRGKVHVVATLGRATRVLNAGLHIVVPFLNMIVSKVPVDEQTLDVPDTGGRLPDGAAVTVKGSVRYRVTQPLVAINDVDDYEHALAELTQTHWRRALETSDVGGFRAALDAALPAIRTAAAAWGIDTIDATAVATVSEEGVRQLEERAARERDGRVLEWLEEREESPGPDGRPTAEQHAAFKAWMEQAVAQHREEIEAARRAERAASQRGPAIEAVTAAAAPSAFEGATPSAISFAVARSAIPAGGAGRVDANGREWTAENSSSVAILAGFRCVVERQDGDTLIVRPM